MKFVKVKNTKLNIDYDYMLMIENESDLMEYHEKSTQPQLRSIWDNLIDVSKGKSHYNTSAGYCIAFNADGKKSVVQLSCEFFDRVINDQFERILKYGKIYINKKGGYMTPNDDLDVTSEIIIDENQIIFPNLTENDIEVKQWVDGKHWYPYVGGIWVSGYGDFYNKGVRNKFDTQEEAYKVAKTALYNMNKNAYNFKDDIEQEYINKLKNN